MDIDQAKKILDVSEEEVPTDRNISVKRRSSMKPIAC